MSNFNRYEPYYNADEERVGMSLDDRGSWVHLSIAERLEKERDEARAKLAACEKENKRLEHDYLMRGQD